MTVKKFLIPGVAAVATLLTTTTLILARRKPAPEPLDRTPLRVPERRPRKHLIPAISALTAVAVATAIVLFLPTVERDFSTEMSNPKPYDLAFYDATRGGGTFVIVWTDDDGTQHTERYADSRGGVEFVAGPKEFSVETTTTRLDSISGITSVNTEKSVVVISGWDGK